MTNTLIFPTRNFSSMLSEQSAVLADRAALQKNRSGKLLRKTIAIGLLTMGSFFAMGTNAQTAIAKKIRQVKSKLHSHEYRLLNIYNSLKATHPGLISAMNNARSGVASWYGGIFQHRKTAMGTTYDMYALTAAHRSLPLGTWVEVTNESNGKSVTVQVTDRGPYVASRVMDLSYAAAQKLGYANAGTTHISMKVLGTDPDLATATPVADYSDATSATEATSNDAMFAKSIPVVETQSIRSHLFSSAKRMMAKAPLAMIR